MIDNAPLISIIIPCYNNSDTLIETLQSIQLQTYLNTEIIIVDDCSVDDSFKLAQTYILEKKINGNVYKNNSNQGPSVSRNKGVNEASGKYLLFLDADDLIEKTYIKKCIDLLENRADLNIIYSEAEFFGSKNGKWELPDFKLPDFLINNCIPVSSVIKKEVFDELGGFDEKLRFTEDWELWIRIISNFGGVYKIPEVLFYYRKRNDNSSLTDNMNLNSLDEHSRLHIYNKHYNFYKKNGFDITSLISSKIANEYYKNKYYNQWFKKLFYRIKRK